MHFMYIWRNKTNPCPLGDDATGHKRERDRAKRQAMAKEKKDEKNKKRREAYHKGKEQRLKIETNNGNLWEIWVINNRWINIVISYIYYMWCLTVCRCWGCIKQAKYVAYEWFTSCQQH